ncbi:MAG: DMT family transporter [Chloroflexota bacterium]|nr:DMT family transporter [Chloroflexota bacterium]
MSTVSSVMRRARALPIGYVYVLIAITGGSIASVITKAALSDNVAPIPLLASRLIVSAVLLWIVMGIFFRRRLQWDRRLLIGSFIAGTLNAISLTAFYLGLAQIDASVATVLFSTNPVVVLALLALTGIRPTRLDGIRAALALVGVMLLVGVSGQVSLGGAAWIMVTVVFYSLHLLAVQRLLKGYSTVQITPLFITVMALWVNALQFLTTPTADWYNFTTNTWVMIGVLAVFSTVLARLALTAGIQRIGSGQTALLTPVETLMAVTWAALFIGERLEWIQIVGGGLILFSAALVLRRQSVAIAAIEAPDPGV